MKNKKVVVLLIFGVAIMIAMLYFIGIEEVIDALEESNLWYVLLAIFGISSIRLPIWIWDLKNQFLWFWLVWL